MPYSARAASESNLLQNDRLIEIDAVESDIEEEPAETGAYEDAGMAPFRVVLEEFCRDSWCTGRRKEGKTTNLGNVAFS